MKTSVQLAHRAQRLDARAKTLDTFLSVLYERKHDVSGYVRSACLKTWLALCKEDAIPLNWLARVAELAKDRINDKSSLVRRNALAASW